MKEEPKFIDDYNKREWIGRQALKMLAQENPDFFKYQINYTENKFSCYDAYYFTLDNETHSIKKRVFIEIKVRHIDYPELILEKKKLVALLENKEKLFLKDDECVLLYLCFTPTRTMIWNITDMDPKDTKKLKCNKATSTSTTDKVNKDVIYLDNEKSKEFDFVYSEKKIMRNYMNDYLVPMVEKKIEQRGLGWLFV
jgi:hypothetical protein